MLNRRDILKSIAITGAAATFGGPLLSRPRRKIQTMRRNPPRQVSSRPTAGLALLTARVNDVVGTYTLRGYLVKVSRADGPPPGVWMKPAFSFYSFS